MPPDPSTRAFEAQRPRLLRLAYRMLGTHAEAEDIVQEAWLRWHRSDRDRVAAPAAWLTRIVSRLCLDAMKSARFRRETYPGTWLPEPLIEPADEEMRADNITLTLMVALERLSPLERAAFLLHDVFNQPVDEVAATLQRSPAAIRQLAARARAHVRIDQPRYAIAREDSRAIVEAFFEACRLGDATALGSMLAEDVTLRSDGGGKVMAFPNAIHGMDRLVRLYLGLSRKLGGRMEFLGHLVIDGLPGFLSRVDGHLQTSALDISGGRITAIYITRNPEKLAGLTGA
ncbi:MULTISPECIES: sigma-70 family RNA polymerase sigma factor [unclassified Shinella]|uniref:sigma-70 family RNA polymerase sigma factor n=1 Tax=Shinella TaxID=323620 RepID=UPI00225C8C8B|nr:MULTISPECIES: sigma-70 family RNA polymerase sigma factor [unclassified Shinella]MCO5137261.1 sigma-70 family RNA polymerase sigma factor [Shinella sp.]MDC7257563.1 sigma-70 family RNA polymerase sigma factor [Shinella sp. YE25]CAI0340467.1 ECF RNA polymerase sigma factor SigJ [Rhizobiaceae bacterium]CAK7258832.1 ECF RNA polymerase sigma factor SigJ [Shinella sp. WSC3-e]